MEMTKEIQEIFGENLVCVADYGKGDMQEVIVLNKLDSQVLNDSKIPLQNYFKKTKKFPLLLTKEELTDGMDVFPLDFLNIKLNHKILFGEDVFSDLKFDKKHIRRQLEFEFRSKLINLRQSYMVVKSNKELKLIVENSIPTLLPMLNGLLFLKGKSVPEDIEEILNITEKEYGINISALKRIKESSDREGAVRELVDLLSQLGQILDGMKV
ncbi:hypothetical protein HOF78_01910 [Candidatus Woesearchaeota archaeon]|jgi:hypothetical protein|nr:hypothetical protein [Candidatus Woesearchaeota archaeon]